MTKDLNSADIFAFFEYFALLSEVDGIAAGFTSFGLTPI